jgi:hypothetical protein
MTQCSAVTCLQTHVVTATSNPSNIPSLLLQHHTHHLLSLPPYIIMHVKRFVRDTQNRCEKNPTIVNFPIKNLDMRDFCTPEAASAVPSTRYDLVANVCHEGSWDHGTKLQQHADFFGGFVVDFFRLRLDSVALQVYTRSTCCTRLTNSGACAAASAAVVVTAVSGMRCRTCTYRRFCRRWLLFPRPTFKCSKDSNNKPICC